MNDPDGLDARLESLFAATERAPDEAFVARIDRALAAERRIAAARKRMWQRFLVEAVASLAIILAFRLLWRLGESAPAFSAPSLTPAAAAALALAFLYGLVLKPAAVGR